LKKNLNEIKKCRAEENQFRLEIREDVKKPVSLHGLFKPKSTLTGEISPKILVITILGTGSTLSFCATFNKNNST
jgi:hypothetical protein